MVVFPTGQPDKRRIQHRRSTSQDSQATITQTSCVTEKAPTRNFYTTDPYSLIRDTRSYQQHTKKSTFSQDHWRQWHGDTDTQRKKPTFFQDHQNSNHLKPQKLRIQHRSGNQDKNTADSQKQKKLSFKPHLLIMMIETLSGTILSRNFHLTLSTRQNQILPLSLILYFQKEGRKSQKMTHI